MSFANDVIKILRRWFSAAKAKSRPCMGGVTRLGSSEIYKLPSSLRFKVEIKILILMKRDKQKGEKVKKEA
jgi:hypothetical protein